MGAASTRCYEAVVSRCIPGNDDEALRHTNSGEKVILKDDFASPMSPQSDRTIVSYLRRRANHRACAPDRMIHADYDGVESGKLLGSGVTGNVRVVHDKMHGKEWACKEILLSGLSKFMLTKLRDEIEHLLDMDHPNIIRIKSVYEDGNKLYLVTELCAGGELFHRLEKSWYTMPISKNCKLNIPEEEVLGHMTRIVAAVSYCHANGIVHGDLKPENFVFGKTGHNSCDLKLIDFGLSTRYTQGFTSPRATKIITGSLPYMAPEMLEGQCIPASDMWSLGVIAYVLLSGKNPFDADDDEGIKRRINNAEVRFPKAWWEGSTEECQDFIKSLLRADPEQRLTGEAAMSHPWFGVELAYDEPPTPKEKGDTVQLLQRRLQAYKRFGPLKKMSLLCVALHLDHEGVAELRRLFSKIDRNHDGMIQTEELQEVLQAPEEECNILFQELDQTGSGFVSYSEFMAAMMERSCFLDASLMHEAWMLLDQNDTGSICTADLERLLGTFIGKDKIEDMIKEADFDADGFVTKEEWMHVMLGTTPDFGRAEDLMEEMGAGLQFDLK